MRYGLDYLAGIKFRKVIMEEHPNGWGAGFFTRVMEDDTYRKTVWDNLPIIQELAASKRAPFIRLAFAWRDDHKFSSAQHSFVKSEAMRFKPIIESNSDITWYVSPVHEHQLNERDWNVFSKIVRDVLGDKVTIVNCPVAGKGFASKIELNEYHGADKKPRGGRFGFSFDGSNIVDADVETYKKNYSNSEYFFIWNCQMNGRRKEDDKTKRKDRKFYPINKQIDSFIYLSRDKGANNFPKDCIGKSHADQANYPPSGKDCKPVFLAYLKAKISPSRIILKARNGQTVSTSSSRASWSDEATKKQIGWRYYFSEWGFEIAGKAKRIQGDSVCDLYADNKKIGTWNPAFRSGTFR